MALVQKRDNKRTVTLIAVLGSVIIIGAIVYFTLIAPPGPSSTTPTSQIDKRDLPIITQFDTGVFNDPRYRAMEPRGDLPVNIGNVGRTNPFIPPD